MSKKKGDYLIPFDQSGNQQHYPEGWYGPGPAGLGFAKEGPIWKENTPFQDSLTFEGISRGRSAAYFRFKKLDGKSVVMFMADVAEALPFFVEGKLTGTFRYTKRGCNYGIQFQPTPVVDEYARRAQMKALVATPHYNPNLPEDMSCDN